MHTILYIYIYMQVNKIYQVMYAYTSVLLVRFNNEWPQKIERSILTFIMSNSTASSSDHRINNRRNGLKAHEQQAATLERLLANPNKSMILPKHHDKSLRPPREIMKNVSGSSAGAGSGEFHVYKHSRRREYERIQLMEEAAEKERLEKEFNDRQNEARIAVEQKTNKNRAKRDKRKAAKEAAKIASHQSDRKIEPRFCVNDAKEQSNEKGEDTLNFKKKRLNAEGASKILFQTPDSSEENGIQ